MFVGSFCGLEESVMIVDILVVFELILVIDVLMLIVIDECYVSDLYQLVVKNQCWLQQLFSWFVEVCSEDEI